MEGMMDNKKGERREGKGGEEHRTKTEGGIRTEEVRKEEIEEGA